jgi:hypothetical protein
VDYSEYDCALVIDVLEHIFNPVEEISKLANSIKLGGYMIVANHFYPSIKCHLPCTFYLRYSFEQVVEEFGFQIIGSCFGSHAQIFKKVANININPQQILWIKIKARINTSFIKLENLWQSVSKYIEKQVKKIKRKIKSVLTHTNPQ